MSELGETRRDEEQFDEEPADEVGAGPACGACGREILGDYYECNGVLVCEPCRGAVAEALAGGSGLERFARATVFGSGAAVAGFAIYFGIMKMTGLAIGFVSILVGLMVGGAVRAGSRKRGGWPYQLLAMFLVYTAIVASYTSVILPVLIAKARQEVANPPAAGAARPAAEVPGPGGVLGQLAILILMLIAFLYALPIRLGLESPMGLLIIGFALWEAWKMNRKTTIVFNGPFALADE